MRISAMYLSMINGNLDIHFEMPSHTLLRLLVKAALVESFCTSKGRKCENIKVILETGECSGFRRKS